MKRSILLAAILFACLRTVAQDHEAEQIVFNYVKLVADKGYLDTIRTTKIIATAKIQGGDSMNILILKDAGRAYYMKVTTSQGQQVRIYNKGKAVMMVGSEKTAITDAAELDELKLQTNILPDVAYKKHGYKMTLEGISKLDGVEYHAVRLESPNGYTKTNYYETKTGLLRRIDVGGIITQLTEYVKFKGGLYNKRNIVTFPEGAVLEMVIEEITNNEKIDPAVFEF
ncbi:MAG TPA: hypothetical protein VD993_11940 [Chitinophagaceae bacterium]|nr:hypothetical protein [Chitinophagaceae bacterium]